MEHKVSYIYKITNLINGNIYIGQSVKPLKRIMVHIRSTGKTNYLLHYAIKKYGIENFLFEIIRSEVPIDQINDIEIQCIKEHNCKIPNGYNLTDGGDGVKGYIYTDEHRKKLSLAKIGKSRSECVKKAIKETLMGHTVTEETRKKMSKARMGYVVSEETKAKIGKSVKKTKAKNKL